LRPEGVPDRQMTEDEKELYRCLEYEQMIFQGKDIDPALRKKLNKEVGVKITVK